MHAWASLPLFEHSRTVLFRREQASSGRQWLRSDCLGGQSSFCTARARIATCGELPTRTQDLRPSTKLWENEPIEHRTHHLAKLLVQPIPGPAASFLVGYLGRYPLTKAFFILVSKRGSSNEESVSIM